MIVFGILRTILDSHVPRYSIKAKMNSISTSLECVFVSLPAFWKCLAHLKS